MPALPWTTTSRPPDPNTECTVLAAKLPLRSHRDLPRLAYWTLRIQHQLGRAPGLIGYAVAPEILDKTLWTVSAWRRRTDLAGFDRSGAHQTAKRLLRTTMLPSTLVVWDCPAHQLPVSWDEVRHRIAMAGPHRVT